MANPLPRASKPFELEVSIPPDDPNDPSLVVLTAEEKAKIRQDVESEMKDEMVGRATRSYREDYRRQARKKSQLDEEEKEIYISLPDNYMATCPYVMIDFKVYSANMTYTVPESVHRFISSMLFDIWAHDHKGMTGESFAGRQATNRHVTERFKSPATRSGAMPWQI